jgi:hypothetical protein
MANNQCFIPRSNLCGGIFHTKETKKMSKRKQMITSGIICAVLPVLGWILAAFTLRSLGALFGGLSSLLGEDTANTMQAIFSQTKDADVRLHIVIPLLAAALLFWFCCRVRTRKGCVLCVFCGILAFLVIYLSALFLSRVNDIRFIDLVISLAGSISDGLFDSM